MYYIVYMGEKENSIFEGFRENMYLVLIACGDSARILRNYTRASEWILQCQLSFYKIRQINFIKSTVFQVF